MSDIIEIQPAGNSRRNRPQNKEEKNARRTENRSKLAAKQHVARSLRPNEWLQEECAEAKPEALIIRDEWQFKMPDEAKHRSEPDCTCAEAPLTAEEQARAAEYQGHMIEAHAFGLKMASVNDTLSEMGMQDDAAQNFALSIWRDLISGKYEEQGKFKNYLKVRWGFFLDTITQKLWDERDNFKGIQSESFNEKTGRPNGIAEGYVSEATASNWVHRADRASEQLKANVDRKLSRLSTNNRSLLELWLDMEGPTQEQLARELGVSKKTVQRRLGAARHEATGVKGKPCEVTSIGKRLDLCGAADQGCVVDISAAAEESANSALSSLLIASLADEIIRRLKPELAKITPVVVQPALLDVKQSAVYLGRSERAIEHMVADRELPVVRVGRRVHLNRADLDRWIEKNTY